MSAIETAVIIPAGTWVVDPVHTTVGFQVTDTTDLFSTINGRFTDTEGRLRGRRDAVARRHRPRRQPSHRQRAA